MSRSWSLPLTLGGLTLAGLTACPTRTPVGPPPVHVPPGCEQSQAGEYHHVGNPAFRYLAEDDGRILSLHLLHTLSDGGVGGTPDGGNVMIVLARTPEGFVGSTHATGFSAGTPCPVKFPTEVTACTPAALKLRSVWKTSLDEACRPPSSERPLAWAEQELRRGPPPPQSLSTAASDAGLPASDAGLPASDAGTKPLDAGAAASDAGSKTPDAGSKPDAGA
ncbi:hypothetical protein [Hyalangium versicolor]|uniref:hypothetical protein n=1 Tax=Hyalangium versicolor TaxID=2861190 RepID=UPI001CCB4512|nr:hypothetical protein [Hyalangium versicolor]